MQNHASAIFQCDELAYREALGTRFVRALGAEVADGAKACDATWLDAGETIRAAISSGMMSVPTTLHIAHLSTSERPSLTCLAEGANPVTRNRVIKRSQPTRIQPFHALALAVMLSTVVTRVA